MSLGQGSGKLNMRTVVTLKSRSGPQFTVSKRFMPPPSADVPPDSIGHLLGWFEDNDSDKEYTLAALSQRALLFCARHLLHCSRKQWSLEDSRAKGNQVDALRWSISTSS